MFVCFGADAANSSSHTTTKPRVSLHSAAVVLLDDDDGTGEGPKG